MGGQVYSSSLRGKTVSFDEAISGVFLYKIATSLRFSQGIVAWIPNRLSYATARSVTIQKKIIKNVIKLAFFTGLLRQLLRNFLAMTKKPNNNNVYFFPDTTMPMRE